MSRMMGTQAGGEMESHGEARAGPRRPLNGSSGGVNYSRSGKLRKRCRTAEAWAERSKGGLEGGTGVRAAGEGRREAFTPDRGTWGAWTVRRLTRGSATHASQGGGV